MITKTIGGDRVGSGKKMKAHMHEYNRSTHNLSEVFASTMGAGILYPAMCKLATRGDSFDIEINADCRTIPTLGALFGSFKFQVDVYQCPVRLYQALLHNNPLAIGLNANQIKFPKLHIRNYQRHFNTEDGNFNNSCLLKYLGISGMGTYLKPAGGIEAAIIERNFNAVPALAYYDIFKNYYSNKQEDIAYVITSTKGTTTETSTINKITYTNWGYARHAKKIQEVPFDARFHLNNVQETTNISIYGENLNLYITIEFSNPSGERSVTYTLDELIQDGLIVIQEQNNNTISFTLYYNTLKGIFEGELGAELYYLNIDNAAGKSEERVQLTEFNLQNIDDMRYDILSHHTLGSSFVIGTQEGEKGKYLPYSTLVNSIYDIENATYKPSTRNLTPLNGLVVKTYLNDIFNNWLNQDWIEGENSISELTKVAVVDGAFTMDAVNMAQKLYNMLNRVAISGGTYEDYQDVVWEEVKRRQIESPIFCGGMSQEIMFDEVIQTAPADGDALGTLGGRGKFAGKQKGGRIHIKCDEACFIIAIASITPRLYFTQGNEFYNTELDSFDDLHKPALDGIGFQDLLGERLAAESVIMRPGTTTPYLNPKVGKVPAWIEYMTSVNKAYGDFAATGGVGYMILNRNYTPNNSFEYDFTTYIDPAKYNYCFAYDALDAQNFWVQIGFDIKARRLMSARVIPNV